VADTASGAEVAQTGPPSNADAGRFKVGEKATIFLQCGDTMVTYQAAEGVFVEVPGSRGGKNEYGWKILCLVEPVLHRHHQMNVGQTMQWGYVHEVPAATQHHQQQQQQQQHDALEASPALLATTRAACESEGGMQGGAAAAATTRSAAAATATRSAAAATATRSAAATTATRSAAATTATRSATAAVHADTAAATASIDGWRCHSGRPWGRP
jgi:hypothetical protein